MRSSKFDQRRRPRGVTLNKKIVTGLLFVGVVVFLAAIIVGTLPFLASPATCSAKPPPQPLDGPRTFIFEVMRDFDLPAASTFSFRTLTGVSKQPHPFPKRDSDGWIVSSARCASGGSAVPV